MKDESELIDRLKNKITQNQAFEYLLFKYKEPLYWHIRKIVLNHDDADDILQKSNIDFNLLQPLIRQTIKKIEKYSPKNVQTGPAKRNDKKIIESHLQSLEKNQQELYKIITNSIILNND